MEVQIKKAIGDEQDALLQLYRTIAEFPDGIIRNTNEITLGYIEGFMKKSLYNGLMLVARVDREIVGEIHAYTPNLFAFQHLLTDLTIVVHPDVQGKGIGKKLFHSFLEEVKNSFPHILRVELYTREHNQRNIAFYESLGFLNEGRQENKIYIGAIKFHTPLHMVWFNPNYKKT